MEPLVSCNGRREASSMCFPGVERWLSLCHARGKTKSKPQSACITCGTRPKLSSADELFSVNTTYHLIRPTHGEMGDSLVGGY